MQPQVSDIAFGVSIAPQTEQSTAADLIDLLRLGRLAGSRAAGWFLMVILSLCSGSRGRRPSLRGVRSHRVQQSHADSRDHPRP